MVVVTGNNGTGKLQLYRVGLPMKILPLQLRTMF
jgi:hypothetical protein